MSSYNPNNINNNIQSFNNKGFFNKFLRNVSNFGMNYDDMIFRNTVGVSINEDPMSAKSYTDGNNIGYDFFSRKAVSNVLSKKSIPYLDKTHSDKRRILREYSIKDEIRDFVSTLADDCIIYSDKDFCNPTMLPDDYSQDIKDKYQEYFEKIYNRYGFSDGISAWNLMRDFLIDGYVALEIVWDDTKKNIIFFSRMDPSTLVPSYEHGIGNLWIQFPEDPQLRRIFLDSQIVFVSYSTQHDYSEMSYVEGLIKPYNQLKIIEQTRIMFNVINATIYQKFTIPVKGLPKNRAEEQIAQLISDYSEEVEWDDTLGTLTINSSKHLPYNKQIWFPEGEAGTPSMELVSPEGHNLNESDMLTWFYNSLKRASKIPFQRFERENGGGNMFSDASEMTRDEVKFGNFVNRLRANFKELIVKPLKIQMIIEFPELRDDEVFLNSCDINFNSNQIFETWKKLNNMEKMAGVIQNMQGIQKQDGTPYFHIDFLMDEYFGITQEEKDKNQSYWDKYGSSEQTEGGGEYGESDFGDDGSDVDTGGGFDDTGGDMGDNSGADTSEPPTTETGGGEDVDF